MLKGMNVYIKPLYTSDVKFVSLQNHELLND
jgi:hypothetical protein